MTKFIYFGFQRPFWQICVTLGCRNPGFASYHSRMMNFQPSTFSHFSSINAIFFTDSVFFCSLVIKWELRHGFQAQIHSKSTYFFVPNTGDGKAKELKKKIQGKIGKNRKLKTQTFNNTWWKIWLFIFQDYANLPKTSLKSKKK